MTNTPNEAVTAAIAEGLSFYRASLHVGPELQQFVSQSWEDAGFYTDRDGNPVRDVQGNTVANFQVEAIDPSNPSHVAQCEQWFNPEF